MVKTRTMMVLISLLAPLAFGCFTIDVVNSPRGVEFSLDSALEAVSAFENLDGSKLKTSLMDMQGFKVSRLELDTPSPLGWIMGLYTGKWVDSYINWNHVKQVRIRYSTGLNILSLFTLFIIFPSTYYIELEDLSGKVLFRHMPIGQLWRNLCPVWMFTSSLAHCRHIAKAIMFLSASKGPQKTYEEPGEVQKWHDDGQ
jgi:hypothetical protein